MKIVYRLTIVVDNNDLLVIDNNNADCDDINNYR